MMKNTVKYILIIGVILGFAACQEEFVPGETSTMEAAGVWQVQHLIDGADLFSAGYVHVETYNTAADDGKEIWINDYGNFWEYKVKCPVDLATLTFSGDSLVNVIEDYDIKVNIRNGKIIPNAAVTASGQNVDSIYYEVWFEDWPETIDYYELGIPHDTYFEVGGERYTGFPDDDL